MPSAALQERLYQEALSTYGSKVADAFQAAMDDLRSGADLQRVIDAIEARNIEAAVQAMNLDGAALDRLLEVVRDAYGAGGDQGAANLPALADPGGTRIILRFSARNVRAEAWLAQHGAEFVTRVLADQQAAIRARLVEGLERGEGPRATALDIVGRVNRSTGKREGGIVGLTSAQERALSKARDELKSGDPAELDAYLGRAMRDKRFDKAVKAAAEAGKPVPAETIGKAVTAYEKRLLELRATTIGRTETLRALNAGNYEALIQAAEAAGLQPSQIRRTWKSAADFRVRHTHQVLNGETVGLNEVFRSPSGASLRFPGDPDAPAAETINCRCWVHTRIDRRPNQG